MRTASLPNPWIWSSSSRSSAASNSSGSRLSNSPRFEMDDEPFEVLLVEDNPGDARLIKELLHEGGERDLRLTHVTSLREAIDRLSMDAPVTHAVLLDLGLPDETGLETLRGLLPSGGRSRVVVMGG